MKLFLSLFALLVLIVNSITFADKLNLETKVEGNGQIKPIFKGLSISNATPSSFAVIKNNLAVLYVNNGKLRFRTKNHKVLIDEGQAYKPKNTWLIAKGKYVHVFWWVKYVTEVKKGKKEIVMGKSLYVRSSGDYGKTFYEKVKVNSANGVLPTVKIAADDNGNSSVIYVDERSPKFRVYVNSTQNGGLTWQSSDTRLDKVLGEEVKKVSSYAGTPHLFNVDNKLVAIWQQYDKNNENPMTRILSRVSDDFGVSWEGEDVLYQRKGDVSSTLDALASKDEVFVFWYDRMRDGILLFSRKTTETKWFENKNIAPGTSTDFGISWLRGVADENYLYLTFTYEKNPIKDYVTSIKYDRKNKHWHPKTHRLDRHSNTLKYKEQSINSQIAMLPNNTVLIVWEDYDSILPGVHMDMLNLETQTWLDDKIRLTKPGAVDVRKPKIYVGDDAIWVVFYYNIIENGVPPVTALASLSYNFSKKVGLGVEADDQQQIKPNPVSSKKAIEEKVNNIWKARLSKNKAEEWPFYDPVYRAKFNKQKWLKEKSGINYSSYSIDSIAIQGVYARVRGRVSYKLPSNIMKNNTILDPEDIKDQKMPPGKEKLSTFSMKFGWFENDWYFVPELMFMQHIDG